MRAKLACFCSSFWLLSRPNQMCKNSRGSGHFPRNQCTFGCKTHMDFLICIHMWVLGHRVSKYLFPIYLQFFFHEFYVGFGKYCHKAHMVFKILSPCLKQDGTPDWLLVRVSCMTAHLLVALCFKGQLLLFLACSEWERQQWKQLLLDLVLYYLVGMERGRR